MKLIFAVKDTAVNAFGTPFYEQTRASAVRAFTDAVNQADPTNQFHKHPEDFVLFQLGQFDEDNGVIAGHQPKQIVRAADVKRD